MNKVILIGNIGKDPEMRRLDNGNTVCIFSMATTKRYVDKNGQKIENTQWHNIQFWGKQAELCEKYLSKGDKVAIEGEINTRSWDDKDGNKRYVTEIIGRSIEFLSTKQSSVSQNSDQSNVGVDNDNDDLPF